MRKIMSILLTIILVLSILNINVFASSQQVDNETKSTIVEIKDRELKEIKDYNDLYGKEPYGMTAYILNKIRIYSIPFCFAGIALAAIYQYIIGIRRIELREQGFSLMIILVTIFVICQILPLVFAIVVRNWRG